MTTNLAALPPLRWHPYQTRLRHGEPRESVYYALLRADLDSLDHPVVLDIGCGHGFLHNKALQADLAAHTGVFIGLEPDKDISPQSIFSELYRMTLEDAPLAPASIDMAYAVMVLEHLPQPDQFWQKLREVLKPGGVFWGFTIDARHWYTFGSILTERLGIKERYLNRLHGTRGAERYENYPVSYRSNTPRQLMRAGMGFQRIEIQSVYLPGLLDYYLPPGLRWAGRALDSLYWRVGRIGVNLAVRAIR
jgi:SAM-dependent methyltransferase